MKIEKNARGWQISPSTSDERTALEFLLNALEEKYAKVSETTGVEKASYSQSEDRNRNMVETV